MKKKVLILFIMLLFSSTKVKAFTFAGCDNSIVSKYKSLVTNINISYDYSILNNKAYFNVTLTNITPGMYFIDSSTYKKYTYNDTINGEITIKNYTRYSGSYKFYLSSGNCNNVNIGTKYYKFPIYNTNYNNELCFDIRDYALCKRWISKEISTDEFVRLVTNYKESLKEKPTIEEPIVHEKTFLDKLVEFYIKYYYYLLPILIIMCIVIINQQHKKNKFNL